MQTQTTGTQAKDEVKAKAEAVAAITTTTATTMATRATTTLGIARTITAIIVASRATWQKTVERPRTTTTITMWAIHWWRYSLWHSLKKSQPAPAAGLEAMHIDNGDDVFARFLEEYKAQYPLMDNDVSHMMTLSDSANKLTHCIDMIDSGASIHGTPYLFRLQNLCNVTPILVTLADKSTITLSQAGSMTVDVPCRSHQPMEKIVELMCKIEVSTITLHNVYYHPKMHCTLISQAQLCKDGYKFEYNDAKCTTYNPDGSLCSKVIARNNLYIILSHHHVNTMNALKEITLYDLHKKWGHVSYDYLKKLIAQNPEIINYKIKDFTEVKCVECGEANIKRNPIPH
jgi:hypothetical protein